MHPAGSVIFFTTASGAGYGLLALLGVLGPLGAVPRGPWFAVAALGLALVLITLGLVSSTFHLGHPERAWRAFSQWRSSWLSREGVAAVATYVPAGLFAIAWVFFATTGGIAALFGVLAALGAAATVTCTAMIYRSLKPIHQWHNPWVVPVYLSLALASGTVWLNLVVRLFGTASGWVDALVLAALALAWTLKWTYWRDIDTVRQVSGPESATGLGTFGEVRLLEPPHTEDNYLLREMGFRVARRHAAKLRRLALALGGAAPLVLTVLMLFAGGWGAAVLALLAASSASAGIVIERWLFFAEARHTVTLYYGRQAA
jgi:DMSO reductase anchor subunit